MDETKINGNIWIEISRLKLGRGRVNLLENIKKFGSITAAAKSIKIPYRQAWAMVKEMNNSAKTELVKMKIGGKHGGGAILTEEGEKVLLTFYKTQKQFEDFKEKTINSLNK
ncbi:MAG: LysR family transcriptional regulator [Bacteroidetes bacterium]|nr:LysR family transcriptional regulator [Bacteroidota bacterium]